MVKNLPEMQQTWVQSLSWQDPLEKGMATQPSTFFKFIIFIWFHQVLVGEYRIYFPNQGLNQALCIGSVAS